MYRTASLPNVGPYLDYHADFRQTIGKDEYFADYDHGDGKYHLIGVVERNESAVRSQSEA
jgi:hypothetical protein